ncbi:hypothetical protein K466DRAFT_566344 [Polyporus arcularius HHB13444]|uniref:Uncharacterized protein n=1 Tax=Polyporus arcularius HHB13444 TaxID=1314778 RepID=A0A5C3PCE4_9APHY|nr:hypothetical protein K466DRAFT_566344 [Polyporus arcularius HHB13444]
MPRIDPPFPSFTFVATKMAENRLPAYRHTHLGRYHPYARVVRQRLEDAFMAIDAAASTAPPTPALRPTTPRTEPVDNDVSSLELDGPVVEAEPEEEVLPRVEDQDQLGRPKISAVLTDLVGVLRRWLALLVLDAHNADARK